MAAVFVAAVLELVLRLPPRGDSACSFRSLSEELDHRQMVTAVLVLVRWVPTSEHRDEEEDFR